MQIYYNNIKALKQYPTTAISFDHIKPANVICQKLLNFIAALK